MVALTANASTNAMIITACQSSTSATILPTDVATTIATENAAYTTEIIIDMRCTPTSSGMNVTPTASSAPETAPSRMRAASSTSKVGANVIMMLETQNSAT